MSRAHAEVFLVSAQFLARALRHAQPFASLSEQARFEHLRLAGMHAPLDDERIGCDAFDVRPDVTVADACETVDQILHQLQGTLEVLSVFSDANISVAQSCGACASLARQAGGALAVIKAVVFPGNVR